MESAFHQAAIIARSCFSKLRLRGEPKNEQILALTAALIHRDVFVCLPTGFGKSFCFQAIPLAFEEISIPKAVVLVISPLLALIDDQVAQLNSAIAGFAIHLRSQADLADVQKGAIRVMFVTPETLTKHPGGLAPGFADAFFHANLRTIVLDEAHCLVLWGDTFRPAYNDAVSLLPTLPPASIMALTATATQSLVQQVIKRTGMNNAVQIVRGEIKTNIFLEVRPHSTFNKFLQGLVEEVKAKTTSTPRTVIFFSSLDTLSTAYSDFVDLIGDHGRVPGTGFRSSLVAMFHGESRADLKEWVLEMIADPASHLRVLFVSSAFGLGIDGKGITRIVHEASPSEVDDYIQEIGRAGRAGEVCMAILFAKARFAKEAMKEYIRTDDCRREFLTKAMGYNLCPAESMLLCCDNCKKRHTV